MLPTCPYAAAYADAPGTAGRLAGEMSEHPSTGPAAAAPPTEQISVPAAASTTMHHADAAYLPAVVAQPEPAGEEGAHEATRPFVTIVLPCFNEGQHVLQEI